MLAHLEPHERKALILSVGTHRAERPLSPLEVGVLVRKATERGADLREIAEATQLEGTTQLSRFTKLLELPPDTHHLIDWGKSIGGVGFTTAFEIARLSSDDDKRQAVAAVVEHGLSSAEARSLVQLRRRGAKSIKDCVDAVIKMRPIVEIRRVLIGSVTDPAVRHVLAMRTQAERNAIFAVCTQRNGLAAPGISAKLAADRFTIVGPDAALVGPLKQAERLEVLLNECLAQELRGGDV